MEEKDKYEKDISKLAYRNRMLDDSFQKTKLEKVTLFEREKSLKSQLQAQEEELRRAQEKENRL
jgi:hypothetical protein